MKMADGGGGDLNYDVAVASRGRGAEVVRYLWRVTKAKSVESAIKAAIGAEIGRTHRGVAGAVVAVSWVEVAR